MDIELLGLFIKIVKSGSAWGQDIVRLETDDIVQEPAEFVNLTLHLDIGARVFLEEAVVLLDLGLQLIKLLPAIFNSLLLLDDLEELALSEMLSHGLDLIVDLA